MPVNDDLREAAIAHATFIERGKASVVRRVLNTLDDVNQDIIRQIRLRNVNGNISNYRLELLLEKIRALHRVAYNNYNATLRGELRELNAWELSFQSRSLESALPAAVTAKIGLVTPAAGVIYSAALTKPFEGKLLRDWVRDLDLATKKQLEQQIRLGVIQGESVEEMVTRLRGLKQLGFKDGFFAKERRQAEAIVRTATHHIVSHAKQQFYESNPRLIKKYQWVSTLDDRTTPICVIGSTDVEFPGFADTIYRRTYSGDVYIVTTSAGKQLVGTPNHPVLTANGWRALQELQPCEDVVYSVSPQCSGVVSNQDVNMQPNIAKLYKSACNPAIGQVFTKSASAEQFHGDGMIGKHEVNIVDIKSPLRLIVDFFGIKHGFKQVLRGVKRAGFLSVSSSIKFLLSIGLPSVKSAQLNFAGSQNVVDRRFAMFGFFANVGRSHTIFKPFKNLFPLVKQYRTMLAAPESWHDTELFKKTRDSGCCDFVLPAYGASGRAVTVKADHVVSVRREFRDCHVYNISTDTGIYIANGIVVHNCQSLDGRIFEVKETPFGPPAHINCRSVTTPVVLSARAMKLAGLDPGTRSALNGQVPATQTFPEWIEKQPYEIQKNALGVTRANLLRKGKIKASKFYSPKNEFRSLEQLKKLEADAFKRAKIKLIGRSLKPSEAA